MSFCTICHFGVPLDDVAMRGPGGRCVCLACFARETESQAVMPKWLRNSITAIVEMTPA